jgi:hypothetical protein
MGQEDVTKRFAELTIPSTPKPTKVGVNKPIFDAKFNEDGTATNVGTVAMDIVTVPHETLKTRKIGDTTVAQITRQPNNQRYTDGFYWIDYLRNPELEEQEREEEYQRFLTEIFPALVEDGTYPEDWDPDDAYAEYSREQHDPYC